MLGLWPSQVVHLEEYGIEYVPYGLKLGQERSVLCSLLANSH